MSFELKGCASRFESRRVFVAACAILFALICVAIPNYFPLMQPDSGGYVSFAANRTAIYPLFLRGLSFLGLSLQDITYVQIAIFCVALMVLLSALDRFTIGRIWTVLFVVLLGANSYFSSFQRTILTESIAFSAIAVATAFLLDYLRTGRVLWLVLCGLFVGLATGIRPGCIVLVPMLAIAGWLKWRHRNTSAIVLAVALVVPSLVGIVGERLMHRIEYGARSDSILPYVLVGKAAMLVEGDTVFAGPGSASLNRLGRKLYLAFEPAHEFLHKLPSWVAWPVLVAAYEAAGQFQVINKDLAVLADETGVSQDYLREQLGKQAMFSNFGGYMSLSLTHYLGQWSIAALTFPPTAKAVSEYSASVSKIPLVEEIGQVPFYPVASLKSYFAYPAFLMAGIVTFILSIALIRYLCWPGLADSSRHRDLMIAAVFGLMCHSSMFLISLINVSTPRFLMMVYPHILLAGLFLFRALRPDWVNAAGAGRVEPN